VTLQSEHALALKGVPNVAVEIVVTSEEVATADAESDRRDTTEDVLVGILHQLAISANVEQTARGIIGASTESHTVREERDGVDIRFMALEGLCALSGAKIPQLSSSIASTGYKRVLISWIDGDAHDITIVIAELSYLLPSLNVP